MTTNMATSSKLTQIEIIKFTKSCQFGLLTYSFTLSRPIRDAQFEICTLDSNLIVASGTVNGINLTGTTRIPHGMDPESQFVLTIKHSGMRIARLAGPRLRDDDTTTLGVATRNIYVPVQVEAWIQTADSVRLPTIIQAQPNYSKLSGADSVPPGSEPIYKRTLESSGPGIYIHWTIPRGYRHGYRKEYTPQQMSLLGVETPNTEISYPFAPNRWLVTRYIPSLVSSTGLNPRSWIVESDLITGNTGSPDSGCTNFYNSQGVGVNIGQTVEAESWDGESTAKQYVDLVIPLAGNLLFADYQPHCQNVFSIFDHWITSDLNDLSAGTDVSINYSVIGWYSSPSKDPISIAANSGDSSQVFATLSNLFLSSYSMAQSLPFGPASVSIFHGALYGIRWNQTGVYDSIPSRVESFGTDQIYCSVGVNVMDAFSALVDALPKTTQVNKAMFDAFVHGHINKTTDLILGENIVNQIYKTGFTLSPGGTMWEIIPSNMTSKNPATPTLQQLAALDALNQSQLILDRLNRLLQVRQSELFAAWWKHNFILTNSVLSSFADVGLVIDMARTKLDDLESPITSQTSDRNHKKELLEDLLTSDLSIRQHPTSSFWLPKDPTLVLTGLSGQDSTWPDDYMSTLQCREVGQLLKVDSDGQPYWNTIPSSFTSVITNLPFVGQQLESIQTLLAEFVVVDPLSSNAAEFTSLIGDPTQRNQPTLLSGYSRKIWGPHQPWAPMFVLWRIRWFNTPFKNWTFEEDCGTGLPGYIYQNSNPNQTIDQIESQGQEITGQMSILPQTNIAIQGRIEQFVKEDPDFTQSGQNPTDYAQTLSNKMQDWDILAQGLSGFRSLLTTSHTGLHAIPTAADADNPDLVGLIGSQHSAVPILQDAQNTPFQPVIHGQFYFRHLQVVDRFGQAIILVDENQCGSFGLAKSQYVTPSIVSTSGQVNVQPNSTINSENVQRWVQVPPRILQDCRLSSSWLTTDGTDQPIEYNSSSNPVCGWVIVNYLDQSLQIYDPNGSTIGELRLLTDQTSVNPSLAKSVNWFIFDSDLAAIMNIYIQKFIATMSTGANLNTLFQLLSRAFLSIQTPLSQTSAYFSAIVGRPLALVRAKWGLELAEPAHQSGNLTNTGDPGPAVYSLDSYSDDPKENPAFRVHIGSASLSQDGVVGYFKDSESSGSTYGPFYTEYLSGIAGNPSFKSIQSLQNTDYVSLTPFFPDPTNSSNIGPLDIWPQEVVTSLLIDPFTKVHAYTQILPVQELQLPQWATKKALQNLSAIIRTGPLLITKDLSNQPIEILQPSSGQWSWLDPQASTGFDPVEISTTKVDVVPEIKPGTYTAIEGFLKLKSVIPQTGSSTTSNLNARKPFVMEAAPVFTVGTPFPITATMSGYDFYDLQVVVTYTDNSSKIQILKTRELITNKKSVDFWVPPPKAFKAVISITAYNHARGSSPPAAMTQNFDSQVQIVNANIKSTLSKQSTDYSIDSLMKTAKVSNSSIYYNTFSLDCVHTITKMCVSVCTDTAHIPTTIYVCPGHIPKTTSETQRFNLTLKDFNSDGSVTLTLQRPIINNVFTVAYQNDNSAFQVWIKQITVHANPQLKLAVPVAPSGLRAIKLTTTGVELQWTHPGYTPESYNILWLEEGSIEPEILSVPDRVQSYLLAPPLKPGTGYQIYIQGVTFNATSLPSLPISVVTANR